MALAPALWWRLHLRSRRMRHSPAFSAFDRCDRHLHGQCDSRGCDYASRLWRLNDAGIGQFLAGLIFGFGLMISGMTQPAKVLGFLDIFGRWDPTLAFVMAGALAISSAGYTLGRDTGRACRSSRHSIFGRIWTDIDRPLIVVSVLFGIGWGLAVTPGSRVRKKSREPIATRGRLRHRDDRRNERAGPVATGRVPSAVTIENAALGNLDG